jgi:hypothetical protein
MSDARLEELRAVAAAVFQQQCHGIEKLKALLTKENFAKCMDEFVPYFLGGSCDVRIHDSWAKDETNCNSIRVHFDAENEDEVHELVASVFPRTERDEEFAKHWVHAYHYHIISREQHQYRESGIISGLVENHIIDVIRHLEYTLRHNLDGAREIYAGDISQMTDHIAIDWASVAAESYKNYARSVIPNCNLLKGRFRQWSAKHRRATWCNLHGHLLDICLALAPLHLSSYELLWILDHVPPMDFKWYKDGKPYDVNHLRKLRLYEGVMHSYEMRHT